MEKKNEVEGEERDNLISTMKGKKNMAGKGGTLRLFTNHWSITREGRNVCCSVLIGDGAKGCVNNQVMLW